MPKTYAPSLTQSQCPFCGLQSTSNEFIKDHVRKHVIDEINAEKIDNEINNVKKDMYVKEAKRKRNSFNRNARGEKNSLKVKVEVDDSSNPTVDTPHPVNKIKSASGENKDDDATFVFVGIGEKEAQEDDDDDSEEVAVKPEPGQGDTEADVPWMSETMDEDEDDAIDVRYYEGTKYDCHLCGETFEDHGAHLCFNHGMIKCSRDEQCNFFFGNRRAARNHELQLHGDKKQNCAHCDKKFDDLYSLIDHRKIQHSLHSCLLCNFILTGEEYFLNHMKKHNITIKEIFKADRPLIDKLLNMSLATFNNESKTVDCNLCVSWNRNDRFAYARKTVEVHEGGGLIWQHFQHIHKMKDPHTILLATFNGQEFGYSNLSYGSGRNTEAAKYVVDTGISPTVNATKGFQRVNKVKVERKVFEKEDESNPDDPGESEAAGDSEKGSLSISFNKIKAVKQSGVKQEVKTEHNGSVAKRPRKIAPKKKET